MKSNALKDRLGYNNPCVGWDSPPSNVIGAISLSLSSTLSWRYAWLDAVRSRLDHQNTTPAVYRFSLVMDS